MSGPRKVPVSSQRPRRRPSAARRGPADADRGLEGSVETDPLSAARQAYEHALESGDPRTIAHTQWKLGAALYNQGDLMGAAQAFEMVANTRDEDAAPRALNSLGVARAGLGDVRGAMQALHQAESSGHAEVVPKATRNLGVVLRNGGDFEGARAAFERAMGSRDPVQAPRAALNLGTLLRDHGDRAGAVAAFRRAMESAEADTAARAASELGDVLLEDGDSEEAEAAYRLAMESGIPEVSASAAVELGLLRRAQGDIDDARAALTRAVESGHPVYGPRAVEMLKDLGVRQRGAADPGHVIERPEPRGANWGSVWTDVLSPLDEAIALQADEPGGAAAVLTRFLTSDIYALGSPGGDLSVPGRGTESNLLHFTVDDETGVEQVLLPVFTQPALMRHALLRNPDWQRLSVLQIGGRALYENAADDATIVVNPWSRLQFALPARPAKRIRRRGERPQPRRPSRISTPS
jgi:tetratricopeptide (TPR) repeat protein